MRCSNCNKWKLGAGDRFCSWCGAEVCDLTVTLEHSIFIVGSPDQTQLTLQNTGAHENIIIEKIETNPSWVEIDDSALRGRALGLAESAKIPVSINTSGLADDFHTATILVKTANGAQYEQGITVSPQPVWKIDDSLPALYINDGEKEARLPVNLLVERGILTVKAAELTNNGWAHVDDAALPNAELMLDSRAKNTGDLTLVIDTGKLPRAETGQLLDRYEVDLQIKFAELITERTQTLRFSCLRSPHLIIAEQAKGDLSVEIFRHETEDLILHLQNGFLGESGRGPLVITKLRCDKPWAQLKSLLPITIESGQTANLDLKIEADALSATQDRARLILETDPPPKELGQSSLTISAKLRDKSAYDGWLCIDFGTTNTCVARSDFDKTGAPILLDIDPSSPNWKVASSAIEYLDSENGERECSVGRRSYRQLLKPESAGTVFDQVKRRLGSDEKLTVHFRKNKDLEEHLTPREIATDIFKELLRYSETELKAKPVRCAISHPSRFSQRQLDDLRLALIDAFKPNVISEDDIKFYHEPIAAAVDYLVTQSESSAERKEYHLLVYDFGGGTTDFALIRVVETTHAKRGRIITPEVLRADGDPALGGEDVTDMVMNLYVRKIELRGHTVFPNISPDNLRLPLDRNAETDLFLQKIAQENRVILREWAEERKLELVREMLKGEKDKIRNQVPPDFTVIIDGSPIKSAMNGQIVELTNAEFNDSLAEMIGPSIEKVAHLPAKAGLTTDDIDLFLLSGQSSALPLVTEKIQGRFKNAKIQQLKNLKECVVRGLCALQSDELESGLAVRVAMQGSLSATTSRLGLRVKERGQYRFKQLVGVGHPIEKDGYSCEVEGVVFRRNTALPLYEHMGPENENSFTDGDPRLRVVKIFRLPDKLAEMGENGKRVTDDNLFEAELWFTVKPSQQVEMEIRFKEETKLAPIKFEATYSGY